MNQWFIEIITKLFFPKYEYPENIEFYDECYNMAVNVINNNVIKSHQDYYTFENIDYKNSFMILSNMVLSCFNKRKDQLLLNDHNTRIEIYIFTNKEVVFEKFILFDYIKSKNCFLDVWKNTFFSYVNINDVKNLDLLCKLYHSYKKSDSVDLELNYFEMNEYDLFNYSLVVNSNELFEYYFDKVQKEKNKLAKFRFLLSVYFNFNKISPQLINKIKNKIKSKKEKKIKIMRYVLGFKKYKKIKDINIEVTEFLDVIILYKLNNNLINLKLESSIWNFFLNQLGYFDHRLMLDNNINETIDFILLRFIKNHYDYINIFRKILNCKKKMKNFIRIF